MIIDFFIDKFEYDFESNRKWIKVLEEHEDELNTFVKKSFSHIINVHHIWVSRIRHEQIESHTNDTLPMFYWGKLVQENYLKTIDFLNRVDLAEKVKYHDEQGVELSTTVVDILYHILNHSNYHRAQISRELRMLNIEPPSFNFISFH